MNLVSHFSEFSGSTNTNTLSVCTPDSVMARDVADHPSKGQCGVSIKHGTMGMVLDAVLS